MLEAPESEKPNEEKIETFAQYVQQHGNGLSLEQASVIAKMAEEFLKRVQNLSLEEINKKYPEKNLMMEYLTWGLIKNAFDQGKSFGKGSFTVSLENPQDTEKLFHYFRGNAKNRFQTASGVMMAKEVAISPVMAIKNKISPREKGKAYSRTSTHFEDQVQKGSRYGHFGIDKEEGDVQMPAQFKTVVFGLLDNGKIYFKPEVAGANIRHRPYEALIEHGAELIKTKVSGGEVMIGLDNFRENAVPQTVIDLIIEDIQTFCNRHSDDDVLSKRAEKAITQLNKGVTTNVAKEILNSLDQLILPKIQMPDTDSLLNLYFERYLINHFGANATNQVGAEIDLQIGPNGTPVKQQRVIIETSSPTTSSSSSLRSSGSQFSQYQSKQNISKKEPVKEKTNTQDQENRKPTKTPRR